MTPLLLLSPNSHGGACPTAPPPRLSRVSKPSPCSRLGSGTLLQASSALNSLPVVPSHLVVITSFSGSVLSCLHPRRAGTTAAWLPDPGPLVPSTGGAGNIVFKDGTSEGSGAGVSALLLENHVARRLALEASRVVFRGFCRRVARRGHVASSGVSPRVWKRCLGSGTLAWPAGPSQSGAGFQKSRESPSA